MDLGIGTTFAKKAYFSQKKKKAEISKINEVLVLKGIFFETTYVCVLTNQITYQSF